MKLTCEIRARPSDGIFVVEGFALVPLLVLSLATCHNIKLVIDGSRPYPLPLFITTQKTRRVLETLRVFLFYGLTMMGR